MLVFFSFILLTMGCTTDKKKVPQQLFLESYRGPASSVFVSIVNSVGRSYDHAVRNYAPRSTSSSVFQIGYEHLKLLDEPLRTCEFVDADEASSAACSVIRKIWQAIEECNEPSRITFNFECAGDVSDTFPEPAVVMEFIETQIANRFTVQLADFALKSLLKAWDSNSPTLGQNPMRQLGTTSGVMKLRFDPQKLLNQKHSAQLRAVGMLSERGELQILAMGGTIVFTIDENAKDQPYTVTVLTRITDTTQGAIGHATIEYERGGTMIVGAGHWSELNKISTKFSRVEDTATKYFPEKERAQWKSEYQGAAPEIQKEMLQRFASDVVNVAQYGELVEVKEE